MVIYFYPKPIKKTVDDNAQPPAPVALEAMKYVSGVYYLKGNDDRITTAAQFNHVVIN